MSARPASPPGGTSMVLAWASSIASRARTSNGRRLSEAPGLSTFFTRGMTMDQASFGPSAIVAHLTSDELAVLQRFAQHAGTRWKSILLRARERSNYAGTGLAD